MREILFRAKRKDNKKWIVGYYAIIGERNVIIKSQSEDYYAVDDSVKKSHGNEVIDVNPETVCQYTGLTDKNGRKIFEGDIVAWRREDIILTGNYTYCFNGYKYGDELIVRCLESGFVLCRKKDGLPDVPNANNKIDNYAFWNNHRFLEVIGNIFDNSELIGD